MRRIISSLFFFGVIFFVAIAHAQTTSNSLQVIVTVVYPPGTPTSLVATTTSSSEIDLTWNETTTNQTGFTVEEAQGNDSLFTPIDTIGPAARSYARTGLLPSTAYFYRIVAFNGAGGSAFSNEAAAVTSAAPTPPNNNPPPSGGGGGGGGGPTYVPPAFQTTAVFRGMAYPLSTIQLLENGQVVATTQAGPDANFGINLTGLTPGAYTFGVMSIDPQGNRSVIQTFSSTLTAGAQTIVSGIFFPPTISGDKTQVKKGDVITLFGYAPPTSSVAVIVNSVNEVSAVVTSTASGVWKYQLSTEQLEYGAHNAHAWQSLAGNVTPDSNTYAFIVGNVNVATPTSTLAACGGKGDINNDCKVNLVDFSIMGYWYKRANPPANLLFDGGKTVDFTDFSILAYYWTG